MDRQGDTRQLGGESAGQPKPRGPVGVSGGAPDTMYTRGMAASEYPVLEVAILDVKPGQADAFRQAFANAEAIISSMAGYGGHELRRCAENDHRFLLLVWWDSVESHAIGFRTSPDYQEWKRLLHHFYEPFPTVEHYLPERESRR